MSNRRIDYGFWCRMLTTLFLLIAAVVQMLIFFGVGRGR